MSRRQLLGLVLRDVSRAFYLTLRVLPRPLREPIGLAYLLARAADTLADTRALPPGDRLRHLLAFRAQVEGPASPEALAVLQEAVRDPTPAEARLLASLPEAFRMLEEDLEDPEPVRRVVVALTRGMELDLRRFPPEESGELAALRTAEDLDHYTYSVAGCVGEFWTRICGLPEGLEPLGVRFGKALQLTNILRDLPRDLRMGRCYLPEEHLAQRGLGPEDLLDPACLPRARPVLEHWLATALDHYRAAQQYALAVPRYRLRLRLAVLWPLLMGLATLKRLAASPRWLDPGHRIKVSRPWVYGMVALSLLAAPCDRLLHLWFRRLTPPAGRT